MSRSYKRTPVLKYAPTSNIGQKYANRRVRRYKKGIPNGMAYKKLYSSYNVHDHVMRETLKETLEYRERCIHEYEYGISRWGYVATYLNAEEKDINLCIRNWKKMYYWK